MINITTEQLVSREVFYRVSTLISELSSNEKYMDELLPVLVQDDYESALIDNHCESFTDEHGAKCWKDNRDGQSWAGSAQEACKAFEIEPQQTEALEHWIVSDWLADKLEAHGEMVICDFLGLTIWGRSCSGQAIHMDYVIQKIHAELINKAA